MPSLRRGRVTLPAAGGRYDISGGFAGRGAGPGVGIAARGHGQVATPQRPAREPGAGGASPPPRHPHRPQHDRLTRLLGWLAAAGIGGAIGVMIAISLAGPSRAVIHLHPYQAGPLLFFRLHPPQLLVAVAIWSAVVAGGAGLAAGLAAVARGARPSPRLLLTLALAAAAVLTVTPAAGSTDTLDYAAYGRMVVIGHDPYVMTPLQLRHSGDPIGRVAPHPWQRIHSVYGPLATVEQAVAAELGGTSPGWIVFWLKLWNSLAFAAVVLALDRLVRRDPVRRIRAHLLWSLNPLLLWVLVAGGHIDALAAGFGFLGLMVLKPAWAGGWDMLGWLGSLRERAGVAWQAGGRNAVDPGVLRGLIAGGLIGAAADLKATFLLFGLGAAWATRRSLPTLAALAGGVVLVLAPSYLWFGPPAVLVLLEHSGATSDNLYRLVTEALGAASVRQLTMVALPVFAAAAYLLLARLPNGYPAVPAVRPAFALALAWLLTWPYQRPWYDAMAFCLLALYPAARLDWPLIWRLVAGVLFSVPGMPGKPVRPLGEVEHWLQVLVVPGARLAALVAVLALCLTGAWQAGQPARPGLRGLVPLRT